MGSVDMSEVEFRRPRPRVSRAHDDQHPRFAGLWWQIALGVFTAMLAHSIVTGLYVRWEIYTGLKAFGAALEDLVNEREARPTTAPQAISRPATRPTANPAPIRPLAGDERCVGGKRFRRVENGWVQVLEACR